MVEHNENQPQVSRAKRFREFLDWAKQQGMSQTEVATRLGLPRQYVTNVKAANRVLTELFARRVSEEFGVDHRWLLHGKGTGVMQRPAVGSQTMVSSGAESIFLPLLYELVSGEPRASTDWNGALVSITGPAVYAVRESEHPYVYRVSDDDSTGRLKQGDLVLVCQGETSGTSSGLFVLEVGHQPTLAWRIDNGRWKSAVRGRTVSAKSKITGHCLGIIWAHF